MSQDAKPLPLPGEVFRCESTRSGGPFTCAIAPVPDLPEAPPRVVQMWVPNPGRWETASVWMHAEVYEAWALHERAVAAAERALRKAYDAYDRAWAEQRAAEGEVSEASDVDLTAEGPLWQEILRCGAVLRALGVTP